MSRQRSGVDHLPRSGGDRAVVAPGAEDSAEDRARLLPREAKRLEVRARGARESVVRERDGQQQSRLELAEHAQLVGRRRKHRLRGGLGAHLALRRAARELGEATEESAKLGHLDRARSVPANQVGALERGISFL